MAKKRLSLFKTQKQIKLSKSYSLNFVKEVKDIKKKGDNQHDNYKRHRRNGIWIRQKQKI